MGNAAAPPEGFTAEAEEICSVYTRAASEHNLHVFEEARRACIARRTSAEAAEAFKKRQETSLAEHGLTADFAKKELRRQAEQHFCEEARKTLEACKAASVSPATAQSNENLQEEAAHCRAASKAFEACVAEHASDKAVDEYLSFAQQGLRQKFVRQQQNQEMPAVTRLHFAGVP